jgi:hypothetical protein
MLKHEVIVGAFLPTGFPFAEGSKSPPGRRDSLYSKDSIAKQNARPGISLEIDFKAAAGVAAGAPRRSARDQALRHWGAFIKK